LFKRQKPQLLENLTFTPTDANGKSGTLKAGVGDKRTLVIMNLPFGRAGLDPLSYIMPSTTIHR